MPNNDAGGGGGGGEAEVRQQRGTSNEWFNGDLKVGNIKYSLIYSMLSKEIQ